MSSVISNIGPFIVAGLINGSFVIPTKYIRHASNEKIWFYHSIIGLMIIPWVLLFLMIPNVLANYFSLPITTLTLIVLGGIIFGLGQTCFAYAIQTVGIALSFAINLSLGVTIGSMFVVFYKNPFFTLHSFMVTLAVILILCSLIIYYYAGKANKNSQTLDHKQYHKGWLLASIAGFASGLQNIVFVLVAFHSNVQFQTNNSFWVWPPFLFAAAIPMILSFWHRQRVQQTPMLHSNHRFFNVKNFLLITIMGLCFTGSLALYSKGMSQLTHERQIIGWPAFMVSIILASQLWGQIYKEAKHVSAKQKCCLLFSVTLLVIAIIILTGMT